MEIIVDLCNQHLGSLTELKRMSLNAYLAGADAVKIQLVDSKSMFGDNNRSYRDIDFNMFKDLKKYCDNLDIPLMATPFSKESFKWIKDLGIDRYKIASRTVKEDPDLCELILADNRPTIISTGRCDIGEFPYGFSENIFYLFCVSKYPTYLYDEKLKEMPEKFKRYGYCGYSDHTIGIAAALEAFNRGCTILEKHYSEDIVSQSKYESGHLCSFDKKSLKTFKDLTKQLSILRS